MRRARKDVAQSDGKPLMTCGKLKEKAWRLQRPLSILFDQQVAKPRSGSARVSANLVVSRDEDQRRPPASSARAETTPVRSQHLLSPPTATKQTIAPRARSETGIISRSRRRQRRLARNATHRRFSWHRQTRHERGNPEQSEMMPHRGGRTRGCRRQQRDAAFRGLQSMSASAATISRALGRAPPHLAFPPSASRHRMDAHRERKGCYITTHARALGVVPSKPRTKVFTTCLGGFGDLRPKLSTTLPRNARRKQVVFDHQQGDAAVRQIG